MTQNLLTQILTRHTTSVSAFKKNPSKVVSEAGGDAVAVLNHNAPDFYAVPAEMFEQIMDLLEDLEDAKAVNASKGDATVSVSLDELRT